MIKLAIIDDNIRLAKGLRRELMGFNDIAWINIYESGYKFADDIQSSVINELPDCILMDISMKDTDEAIVTTRTLCEKYPSLKIIMFTVAEDDDRLFEAFKVGAVGYLLKNEKPSFVYKSLAEIIEGAVLVSPAIARKILQALDSESNSSTFNLTNTELHVLRLLAKGQMYQTIAFQTGTSVQNIQKQMLNILKKFQTNNHAQLANKTTNTTA